LKVRP